MKMPFEKWLIVDVFIDVLVIKRAFVCKRRREHKGNSGILVDDLQERRYSLCHDSGQFN